MKKDQRKWFHRKFIFKSLQNMVTVGQSVVKITYAEYIFVARPAVKKFHQYHLHFRPFYSFFF